MARVRASREKNATARRSSSRRGVASNGGIRTFDDALKFLFSVTDYERMTRVGYNRTNFNLARMNRILAKMGNPHKQLRAIHIAGTKGKGSAAIMIDGMLRGAGYTVGMYTSPHFVDIRERIVVNGQMIPHEAFTELVSGLPAVVRSLRNDSPTFFELMTAVAFKYFAEIDLDFAIVEVGLGGRLDSTNVIKPEVCAITTIGYDHMQQLGRTLPSIAAEKAGVLKPGVVAISAPQEVEVLEVLRQAAEKVGCTLRVIGQDIECNCRFEAGPEGSPVHRLCITTPYSRFEHVPVPALGEHQAVNCAVALGVIDALRERGYDIPEDRAVAGLAATTFPGRMEVISDDPRIVVDAAHNGLSVQAVMRAIGQHINYDSMVVVFACCRDKDITRMLMALATGADKVIFTWNDSPRSADPNELAEQYVDLTGKMAQVAENLSEAIRIASCAITRGDLICITGSAYIVGQAKEMFANLSGSRA